MTILIYGATGYTAKLVARLAHEQSIDLILAGRNPAKIQVEANPHGFTVRGAALDRPDALAAMLKGVSVVLHAAGPFSQTAVPMVDACIANKVHYLDITGEISVFEANARRDAQAKTAGVMLMSGVGFDVVPSDCLAAHTAKRVPDATRLSLAIDLGNDLSRGTLKTMVESMGKPTKVRRDGKLIDLIDLPMTAPFDLGHGTRRFLPVSWGDVASAYYSTGIRDITTYFPANAMIRGASCGGYFFGRLLQHRALQGFLTRQIDRLPEGPDDQTRRGNRSYLMAQVENERGDIAVSRLETPDSYALTGETALAAALQVLAGDFRPGYQTPSSAFGADFILKFAGVGRTDVR